MASPLDEVRRAAHQRLMAQARDRAALTAQGMAHGFGPHGAVTQQPSDPSSLPHQRLSDPMAGQLQQWESRHPAAMAGRAPMPGWVSRALNQRTQTIENSFGGHGVDVGANFPGGRQPASKPVSNPLLNALHNAQPPRGGQAMNAIHQAVSAMHPSPVAAITEAEQAIGSDHPFGQPLFHNLVPLGQGLFLHPITGEIHGLGFPLPPRGGTMPGTAVHPVGMS